MRVTKLTLLVAGLAVGVASCAENDITEPDGSVASMETQSVAAALTFNQISAGGPTCGVTADNRLYCWGQFFLGNGTRNGSVRPVPIAPNLRFRQVSTGEFAGCAVTTDDRAYCWGNAGQVGDGSFTERLTPVPVAGNLRFSQVETSGSHACGVTKPDNRAYCWGDNFEGTIGDGTRELRKVPRAVSGGLRFRSVSPGWWHSCGITTDNRAYCWGGNRVRPARRQHRRAAAHQAVPRVRRPSFRATGRRHGPHLRRDY